MPTERQHLIFDADDTLWENNVLFERTIDDFIEWIDHPTLDPEAVRHLLLDIERANAAAHGYGSKVFLRSLHDCFERLAERPATDADADDILGLAHRLGQPRDGAHPRRGRHPRRAGRAPRPAPAHQGRPGRAAAQDRRVGPRPPLPPGGDRRREGAGGLRRAGRGRGPRPGPGVDDRQLDQVRRQPRPRRRAWARCSSPTTTPGPSSTPSSTRPRRACCRSTASAQLTAHF